MTPEDADGLTPIRQVLCPIDFSPVSLRALRYASATAERAGASLVVLNVFTAPLPLRVTLPQYAGSMLDRRARSRLIGQLDEAASPARQRGVRATVRVSEGDTVDEILRTAETVGADLIVMGTHGRGGLQRLILGSVTARTLRRSPTPVLAVPPADGSDDADSVPRFAKILCAVDFSEESLAALRYALSVPGGEAVTVVHVLEWLAEDERLVTASVDVGELRRRYELDVRASLEEAVSGVATSGERMPALMIARDAPYRGILQAADDLPADLIVMGVGGPGAGDGILGSTTDRVVRAARCPVLTVRR